MKLIAPKSIARALGLNHTTTIGRFIIWFIFKFARLSACNKIIHKNSAKNNFDFVRGLLHSYHILFDVAESDLKKIPKKGPFIIIANHPLGIVDGLLLLYLIGQIRPDFKIFGNYLLHQIEQLQSLIFAVNPFKKTRQFHAGHSGITSAIAHLRNGGALGIFPAGKVATKKDPAKKFPVDEEWNHKMLGLLSREKVPIIPVYFHAKNSRFFYLISKISPALQTLRLTAEAFSQHKRRIQVRVGNLIRARDLNPNDSDRTLSKFLRAKTFVLSRSFNPKKMI